MNIENMTDEKKSVMLAKLCGWLYLHDGITGEWWLDGATKLYDEWFYNPATREARVTPLDLYNPASMALLARVIEWACENKIMMIDKAVRSDRITAAVWFIDYFDQFQFHQSMCEFADHLIMALEDEV